MQTATILKKNISKKQLYIIGSVIGVVALASLSYFGYVFLSTANPSQANEDAPQNVQVVQNTADKVQVKWNTGKEVVSTIEYGTSPDSASFKALPGSGTPQLQHSIDISTLEPDTTYYFQIRTGDTIFNNDGQFWTFKTAVESTGDKTEESSSEAKTEPTVSPATSIIPTPTKTASLSASITPSEENLTPTLASSVCSSSNCSDIQKKLGTICNTQDYVMCIFNNESLPTATPSGDIVASSSAATSTPASTSVSSSTKATCAINNLQANSCTTWSWDGMTDKEITCSETFTRYFVQCKSTSFSSTDSSVWYCNETKTTNNFSLPCGTAPTPAAGQSVFCRVRAETSTGGTANSTTWSYKNTACSAYTSANISSCAIKYLQSNNCRSWIWDLVNNNDTTCKNAFSKYFFQCASNTNFAHTTTSPTPAYWYCNKTSTDHYLDFPCYNAPTPANAEAISCRVRAEDAYGGDSHSTAWTTTSVNCPTSTPTPSITATPTATPTPTRTPTPTPTP